jgi:Xaa-Pro aminopeptidase
MFDLQETRKAITEFGMDGWLLYDFRGINYLAARIADIPDDDLGSRRWLYFVPAEGPPRKLVHAIESGMLDHLPGEKTVYLKWQELEDGIRDMLDGHHRIAMEYSENAGNPYVSRVDAGTVELVRSMDKQIVSSGNLIQYFEARLSDEQWQSHLLADRLNQAAFEMAWQTIADHVRAGKTLRESELQQKVVDYYHANQMTTYHPPIVGVGPNSGDPHYSPQPGSDREIREGDFVLLDMWAKLDRPGAIYTDLTKVGFVGETVPQKYREIFDIVAAARDAGIEAVRKAFAAGDTLFGWQIDDATRQVIEQAGYGKYFNHRTGHNIGQETHGNGAHMDNLETREDRRVIPRTCFSIEPGIYLEEFGVRSEINVYISPDRQVIVTGGLQTEVLPILAHCKA